MFFRFLDLHSGGNKKTNYAVLLIEAETERDAVEIFKEHFERSPYRASCPCCGSDYSIMEYDTLEEATEYDCSKTAFLETSDKEYPLSVEEFLTEPFVWVHIKA